MVLMQKGKQTAWVPGHERIYFESAGWVVPGGIVMPPETDTPKAPGPPAEIRVEPEPGPVTTITETTTEDPDGNDKTTIIETTEPDAVEPVAAERVEVKDEPPPKVGSRTRKPRGKARKEKSWE